jgi:LysR family transcriptional regulator, glycine cleavage system transcriptional activator
MQHARSYHAGHDETSFEPLAMTVRLPPLNALRAFEAAARHLSFKRAAAELHVSAAAISHQVKALEDYLGVKLFERRNRGLKLTDIARAALPKVSEGFQSLAEGAEAMRAQDAAVTLLLSAAPAFAAKWLVPRLQNFIALHPGIDVRLSATIQTVDDLRAAAETTLEPVDIEPEAADVAIRFGSGNYPGFRVDKLLAVSLTPVCSPRLLADERSLHAPEALRHHTLLHDDTIGSLEGQPDWAMWLKRAGVTDVNPARGPHFTHGALALEAAADGLGVALAMDVIAAGDIAAGRLVQPFELKVPLPSAYYVVSPESQADQPHVAAFRNWLLEEAKANATAASREAHALG